MRMRGIARLVTASLLGLALAAPAAALGADNPWLARRVLHIAHQGGESESPSNTMFAYERALANGADVLEMDVNITKDGQLVVFHDTSVDGRTNGTGRVNMLTLAQLKRLDPADNWPEYRGIALGTKPPPPGYTREDFQIPTLREVLQRYPNLLMNIEIKGPAPDSHGAARVGASRRLRATRRRSTARSRWASCSTSTSASATRSSCRSLIWPSFASSWWRPRSTPRRGW